MSEVDKKFEEFIDKIKELEPTSKVDTIPEVFGIEITVDEFDEWFQKFCEGYQSSKRRMRRLHWRFD